MNALKLDIPEEFNITQALIDHNLAAGRGNKVAFHYRDEKLTYNQVASLVNKTGNVLKELGLEMENRVALLLLDHPPFVASFLGAIKIGAVPVPLSTMLRAQDYEYLLNDSRSRILIVDESLLDALEPVWERLKFLRQVLVVGQPQAGQLSFYELVDKAEDVLEAVPTQKDDQAFWLYSSGSTGFPKGAVHLHHDILYCCETYSKETLSLTSDDVVYSAAKLFFAYGLGNSLYFPMRMGASAVLYEGRPLPEKVFEILERYRATVFFAVPTLYASMLQIKDAQKRYDLSSLRLSISAGEALPPELIHQWKERIGLEILDGIGTTEILHIFISNRPGEVRPGSTGKIVPGYEARIVDEDGRDLPDGEVGNLLVRGDSIAAMYWNKHLKSKATFQGEWIATGDKYYRDKDGYYWCCGRGDDMLKVGGIWVSPVEVELTLTGHPAVLECAVVGARDQEDLVKPKAFVVLKEGYQPSEGLAEELKQFVKDKIAAYKYPRWIEFVTELPKTATGKMQRFKLRQ